ncbi:hypothetical protein NU195Hw_g791t1 [Hortaea werneckii]
MHSLYSLLTLTLITAQPALAALNIGCYSGIAGWRRNDVEKIYYQDDQGQLFQRAFNLTGSRQELQPATGPLPLGDYPAVFDSPLAVVQFNRGREIRLYYACPSPSCPGTNSTAICELGSGDGGSTWYTGQLSTSHFCTSGVGRPAQFLYATVDNQQPRVGFRAVSTSSSSGTNGGSGYNVEVEAGLSVAVWEGSRWNLTGPF